MNKQTLTLLIIILGILIMLGYMAYIGSLLAIILLTIGITIVVFCAGVASTIYTVRVMQSKAQADFQTNAQENTVMMQQQHRAALELQRLQNEQSKGLMQQLDKSRQLPENGNRFLIEDGLFDDL